MMQRPPSEESHRTKIAVQCCIVGAGPAGMMVGFLLGRAGVNTLVLEKHADFLRDFRGDTVHPSTLEIMRDLGLLEEFLMRPHTKVRTLSVNMGGRSYKVAEFGRLPAPCNFIALMPQWDFLDFLLDKGRRFPALKVLLSAEVTGLAHSAARIVGVTAKTPSGTFEVTADLVVGCDGRASTVRRAAALEVQDFGAPIDVLWFRLSKKLGDPEEALGHLGQDKMLVTINRTDYWQCAFVIGKGGVDRVHARGIEAFRSDIADGAPFLADRTNELNSFDDVKLLSVSVDRLNSWSKPGLLCIGDAAHAMSPVGGVGINLAIQDAVATANLLAAKLKAGTVTASDLDRVRKRRAFPVRLIQAMQVAMHNRVLRPVISGDRHDLSVPWPLRMLDKISWLRRWPAQAIGHGIRREDVASPDAHAEYSVPHFRR